MDYCQGHSVVATKETEGWETAQWVMGLLNKNEDPWKAGCRGVPPQPQYSWGQTEGKDGRRTAPQKLGGQLA